MSREVPIFTVDAFSEHAFSGNPAAVCFIADPANVSDKERLAIAAEMNLSETAFVEPLQLHDQFDKASRFCLRWFTPAVEVNLCGHATLASAAVLYNIMGNPNAELSFETRWKGVLKTRKNGDLIYLDFPQSSTKSVETREVEDLLKLICPMDFIEEVRYSPDIDDLLVVLKSNISRKEFESLSPEVARFTSSNSKCRGVCLTVKATGEQDCKGNNYDYFTRFFAPWTGINEDPVTGSSYTVTGPYWAEKLGKKTLYARQCSRRGGEVRVQVREDGRVDIAGSAVLTLQGTFIIPPQ